MALSPFEKTMRTVYVKKLLRTRLAIRGYREYQRYVEQICDVRIDGKSYKPNEHYMALKIEIGFLSPAELAQQGIQPDAVSGPG
jgi:hypothetical protein